MLDASGKNKSNAIPVLDNLSVLSFDVKLILKQLRLCYYLCVFLFVFVFAFHFLFQGSEIGKLQGRKYLLCGAFHYFVYQSFVEMYFDQDPDWSLNKLDVKAF